MLGIILPIDFLILLLEPSLPLRSLRFHPVPATATATNPLQQWQPPPLLAHRVHIPAGQSPDQSG